MSAYTEEPGRDYRKERDVAYTERNRLVAALARLLIAATPNAPTSTGSVAWLAEHNPNDTAWDPEWRTIVFIEGPTGQLSWHLHDFRRAVVRRAPARAEFVGRPHHAGEGIRLNPRS